MLWKVGRVGFTTRAEVSRELARAPHRIALGMPHGAFSASHIRYHAHRAGVPVADTLPDTVAAALALIARSGAAPHDGPPRALS